MVWIPDGEEILKICLFVLTECTNMTDERTDGQSSHDGIGRACVASRGKKRRRSMHRTAEAIEMTNTKHRAACVA